ncbi:MAG: hypothetical protein KJZ54_10375 [Phycisphaerales bacterium]|nr:hypothetical protein [Phycisphaerales bacterium]
MTTRRPIAPIAHAPKRRRNHRIDRTAAHRATRYATQHASAPERTALRIA